MRKLQRPPPRLPYLLLLAALVAASAVEARRTASRVRIGMDGGYSDILVELGEDLPRGHCHTILANLKVYFIPPHISI